MSYRRYAYPDGPGCILLLLGILIFSSGLGCKGQKEIAAEAARFGDPYVIVTNETPSAPDVLPHLQGDSLIAGIAYTGGCETHDFTLGYTNDPDTSKVWIYHDASGDECEAYIQDRVELSLPVEAFQSRVIMLLNPQGGPPFMLRWGN